MSTKNTIPNAATIEAERLELVARHESAIAALDAKKAELAALRQPVVEWLAERSELQGKLRNAQDNRDMLQAGVARWLNYQDEVWAGDESARTFQHHAAMPQSDFLAEAGLRECEKYLARTRGKLDTLNTKLSDYCAKFNLIDMLPS